MSVEAIAAKLNEAERFVISCHTQPDGDGMGSTLAVAQFLLTKGKTVTATIPDVSAFPGQYAFLPGRELLRPYKGEEFDVFVALDCATIDRLGALTETAKQAPFLINIDHHQGNPEFGHLNLVDQNACATVLLAYNVLRAVGGDLTTPVAECLYVGLVTDTGRFQYSNTNASAFALAAELIKHGARPNTIFGELYEQTPLAALRLLGIGLRKMVVVPELELAYAVLEQGDFQEAGAVGPDADMIVDQMRSLRGVNIVALVKETKDGRAKVSMRSKGDHNVAAIAGHFGGGGHVNAAGFVVETGCANVADSLIEQVKAAASKG